MCIVNIHQNELQLNIPCEKGQSILSALMNDDPLISSFCGGKGICGKCKIRLIKGVLPVAPEDKVFFSEEELDKGFRLACRAYPEEDCTIEIYMQKEMQMEVVAETAHSKEEYPCEPKRRIWTKDTYAIAVDIGTTTIAMQLIEGESGAATATHTSLNPQRSHGADVLSRIQAANAGQGEVLRKKILDELEYGFRELLMAADVDAEKICEVIISGNTTMIHLLMGYPCESLGVSPFTPHNIAPEKSSLKEMIPDTVLDCHAAVLPGISAFVGGDIVSGLYYCDILKKEKPVLFIDLGTNGEMALGNKDRLLVTSVAAGPAFEGGNISCGVGSIPGAICGVEIECGEIAKVITIGDASPVGICGTGVIEAVSELIKEGIVDETGLLKEEYFEDGVVLAHTDGGRPITIIQKDIREIQLAKSAVRAGVEVLLNRYGIEYEDVETVYLAGGFGYHMNSEKMINIGMLPQEWEGRIKALGNTSLGGAKKVLADAESQENLEKIAELGEQINLAADSEFQQLYMEHLNF